MTTTTSENDDARTETGAKTDTNADDDDGMSARAQWLLVAVLFVSGIVVPLVVYAAGQTGGLQSLGLGFRDTYLALPMLPAVLLGALGVWSAVRTR